MRAFLERLLSPHLGRCYRCDRPWVTAATRTRGNVTRQLRHRRFLGLVGVRGHSTWHSDGFACFPLCEGCWSSLTPEQRVPYYREMLADWEQWAPVPTETRAAIVAAVLAGR